MKKIALLLTGAILAVTTSANASTYRGVTEQFINKQGSSWKWSDFQNIKQVNWESKTPKSDTHNGQQVFQLDGTLGNLKEGIYWSMFSVSSNCKYPILNTTSS